jgi:hypothetical protein
MLAMCPRCQRHVRRHEACPFCGSAAVRGTIPVGVATTLAIVGAAVFLAGACSGYGPGPDVPNDADAEAKADQASAE